MYAEAPSFTSWSNMDERIAYCVDTSLLVFVPAMAYTPRVTVG